MLRFSLQLGEVLYTFKTFCSYLSVRRKILTNHKLSTNYPTLGIDSSFLSGTFFLAELYDA